MKRFGTVALIGSPSSGKSTLFNRISDSRKEITGRQYGITRDRNYGTGHWLDKEFTIIDTGGITDENIPFQREVQNQVELGCQEADVILFVVDGRVGVLTTICLSQRSFSLTKIRFFWLSTRSMI